MRNKKLLDWSLVKSNIIHSGGVDWNAFRSAYKDLTFNQLNEIYDAIDTLYPIQSQHHAIHFSRMIGQLPENLTIIELGCHQGELANRILKGSNKLKDYVDCRTDLGVICNADRLIKSWIGYDFKAVLEKNVCRDKRYSMVALNNWFHETKIPVCDVFLSSHVLEHLSESQVEKTLNHCNAEYLLIEVPLTEDGRDWYNWTCTHVLKWGLRNLRVWLNENGYKIFYEVSELGIIGAKKGSN